MGERAERTESPDQTDQTDQGAAVPPGAVVACVDGSSRDGAVMAYAAASAARQGAPLHVLNVRESLASMLVPGDPSFAPSQATLEQLDRYDGSDEVVTSAVAVAQSVAPTLTVTSSRPWGTAVQTILAAGERAGLLVLGSGRKGALARFFLGSTALSVAAHARCAVVVVGPEGIPEPTQGRVMVGVDGSDDSRAALRYAAREASQRGAELVCLIVWTIEVVDGYVVTTEGSPAWRSVEERYQELLDEMVDPVRAEYPDLAVQAEVVHGGVVPALVGCTRESDLVVVGSRGRGGFTGMLLGSVSQSLLHEALCPVAVVTHA